MKLTVKTSKCTVRFAPKESYSSLRETPKKESLIMLHFHFRGKRMKYSTGYKTSYADWNVEKQRIKTNKAGILNANEVNEYLSFLETNLKKEFSRLIAENQEISTGIVKNFLDNLTKQGDYSREDETVTFWTAFDKFISIKERQVKPVTIRAYQQTITRLKDFEKQKGKRIEFDSININFYHEFNEHLEMMEFSTNTIGKYIKNLKVFMNYAFLEGFTSNLRFKGSDFKVKSEQTTAIYLTDQELNVLKNLDLSFNKNLERARDIFLVGCYTGQRISDYNNLNSENIVTINGDKYLKIIQEKTGQEVNILITQEVKEIFKRYANTPPPKMAEPKLNRYIKDIGRIAGFKDACTVVSTKGGKKTSITVPKFKLISSHTARRSFCTNMYKRGKRIDHIMVFSGHKTEREFYKYIRLQGEEKASHLVESGFFNKD